MAPCPTCVASFVRDAWRELRGSPFRDDAFTEAQWRRHLTWRRYIPEPHISSIVIMSLSPIWLWSVFVAACVGLYATYAQPAGAPRITGHAAVLITPFSLTSFALSLLMLFKTNSSYGRWWEARTLWGTGYIVVRSVLRLCISFVGRDNPKLLPGLYRWTAAVLPALAAYLRQQEHYMDEHLGGLLADSELKWLRQRGIPPIAALQVLSRLLDKAKGLTSIERQQIEALLSQLDVVVGGCERILRQPIPYAYNRHTHRFLLVFFTFLPVVFWDYFEWASLPICGIMAFLLAGVENIGVQIEEPHRVLPLNQICGGTLRALRLMMADREAAEEMAAVAAAIQSGSSPGPDATALALPLAAADSSEAAAGGRPPPPAGALASRRFSCSRCSMKQGRGAKEGNGWAPDQPSPAAAAAGQAVEPSKPSSTPSPSTVRPTSPDMPDVFAGGLL